MNQGAKRGSYRTTPPAAEQDSVSQATGPAGTADDRDAGLVELLQALADEHGRVRAAERLGVDRKTLSQAVNRGRLTPRLRGALEDERQATERAEADDMAERVGRLEAALQDLRREWQQDWRQELQDELQSLREELASLREDVAPAKTGLVEPVPDSTSDEATAEYVPSRIYPELVTIEPAADDERAYGRAWPLVAEWRTEREAFKAGWPSLAGREAEVRMLELEIGLVDEHGLTLPPDGVPWDRFIRLKELRRRRERLELALGNLRKARWRRWLLRACSLGLLRP